MKKILIASLIISAAVSCGPRQNEVFHPRQFPMPAVPAVMTDNEEIASYLAEHFWDEFTDTAVGYHCDSTIINGVKLAEVEQAYANYLAFLENVPLQEARASVLRLFGRISAVEAKDSASNVFETLTHLTTTYLYDANSPYRNEDIYQPFVNALSQSPLVPPERRPGYEYDARMCSLNQVGTPAADFVFSDVNGRSYRLYDIDAEYIILFFSNPGCTACKTIIEWLDGNGKVREMIRTRQLAVLNIYIDEDLTEWYKYMPIYPKTWYNAYDPNYVIRSEILYNVRAIPSLYLLDAEKNVMMKDVDQNRLFFWLENI